MGMETICTVVYDGEAYESKVLLETEALIFRGALKKTVPFREMSEVIASDGVLSFRHNGAGVEVRLGTKAPTWADKILNPKSLLDKLGVKPGDGVALVSVTDGPFRGLLAERAVSIAEGTPTAPMPWIFYQADNIDALSRLSELRESITPSGAIWVLHPKGRKDIRDVDVIEAAKAAGLVDVKVCAFSATHSALKLVVPRDRRADGARRDRGSGSGGKP